MEKNRTYFVTYVPKPKPQQVIDGTYWDNAISTYVTGDQFDGILSLGIWTVLSAEDVTWTR